MQRFAFRLEPVQKLRTHHEKTARQEWVHAKTHLETEQKTLHALQQDRSDTANFGYRQKDRELRTAMYQHLDVLERRIQSQAARVAEAAAAEERLRSIWIKRRQDREALDNLRAHDYQAFRHEQLRREQSALDDLAKNEQAF